MLGAIASEGYHAGAVRELLIQQDGAVVPPYGLTVNQFAQVSHRQGPRALREFVPGPCP